MAEPLSIAAASFVVGTCAGVWARRRQPPLVVGAVLERAPEPATPGPETDAEDLLAQVVERHVPAVVMDARSGWSSPARFERVAEAAEAGAQVRTLSLRIGGEAPRVPLPPGSQLVVQFNHAGRARMFIARLLLLEWGAPEARQMHLASPARVAFGEARAAIRVALEGLEPVYVEVEHESATADARVRDLSATGVGLQFATSDDPHLSPGDPVVLRFDGRRLSLQRPATVRRAAPREYGLAFDAGAQPGDVERFDLLLRRVIDETSAGGMG